MHHADKFYSVKDGVKVGLNQLTDEDVEAQEADASDSDPSGVPMHRPGSFVPNRRAVRNQ